jgi:hypothetical protein
VIEDDKTRGLTRATDHAERHGQAEQGLLDDALHTRTAAEVHAGLAEGHAPVLCREVVARPKDGAELKGARLAVGDVQVVLRARARAEDQLVARAAARGLRARGGREQAREEEDGEHEGEHEPDAVRHPERAPLHPRRRRRVRRRRARPAPARRRGDVCALDGASLHTG